VSAMKYVLGIDGGQTSTKAALATLQGEAVRRVETTAWDTTRSRPGRAKCRAALVSIRREIQDIVDAGEVVSVCTGMTGGSYGRDTVTRWARSAFSCRCVAVLPDMVVNLRGADPLHAEGVVVIAGGGSVAWGRTMDGREAMVGGYGYIIGDEGSAYEIGRQALVAALKSLQHTAPATALTQEVLDHFGVDSIWEARLLLYAKPDPREQLSALARRVSCAAEMGDDAAQQIVERAGTALASMAQAVICELGLTPARVFPTGGVLAPGSPVRRAFDETLRASVPGVAILEPTMPPLGGALVIALEKAGSLTGESLERIGAAFAHSLEQDAIK